MMTDKVKAAIYVRVSTDDQTVENQLIHLTGWAENRGYTIVTVFRESASAWHEGHQRELSRLVSEAAQGRFHTLIVWSLDRLSRQGSLAILELVNKFSRLGVKVLSYQEPWTDAPGQLAELLYALTGWVALMESERRSERTKAGLDRALRDGKRLGRPPGSYDTRKRKPRRRVLKIGTYIHTYIDQGT